MAQAEKVENILLNNLQKEDQEAKVEKTEDATQAGGITDFDDVLELVGSTSTYQRMFLYGILFPLSIFESIFAVNLWFLMDEPNHWCHVPGKGAEVDKLTWRNMTIPKDSSGAFSKCLMFGENGSSVECTSGWEYDFSVADYRSIVTDFNWVCDKSHYTTWVQTVRMVARAVGTFLLGYLADKIGRKPAFILSLIFFSLGRAITLYFADNIWVFMCLSFVPGMSSPMFAISINTIALELSGKDYRAWIYTFTWMTVVVGVLIVPGIALTVPNWFILGWITILTGSISYFFLPFIPESPRWLLSMGRVDEVVQILKNISKWNHTSNKVTEEQLLQMLKKLDSAKQEEQRGSELALLFSKRKLAVHSCLVTLIWIMNSLVFDGLNLNSLNLHGHRYLNFILVIVMEVPGSFFGGILSDKFGRRWMQVLFFLLCGVSCVIAAVFSGIRATSSAAVVVGAANVAKFSVTMSFLVIYLQATELFPTRLRATISGFASSMSSVALIVVPYVVYTGKSSMVTPWIVSSVLSFVGMVAAAFVPETINQKLPETLEEADKYGKGRRFWSFTVSQSSSNASMPKTFHQNGLKDE